MNIKQALEYGVKLLKEKSIPEPILKTKIVLAHFMNKQKEYLLIHEDEDLHKATEQKYIEAIRKLCENTPIQYITNKQEFMKIQFYVDESVLIPQPDTEILVEEVINIYKERISYQSIQNNKNLRFMYRKRSNRYFFSKKY